MRGDAFRPAGDSLESLGAITFEVGANGAVNAGTVLEFVMSSPVRPSALVHYLAGYWRESFGNPYVVVAEFSMH